MSREKQIEEMANDYYEAMLKARGTLGSMNEGAPKWYAKELYAKGYRKASEVAREIFEEIEKFLVENISAISTSRKSGDALATHYFYEGEIHALEFLLYKNAELKKKYTEGEG